MAEDYVLSGLRLRTSNDQTALKYTTAARPNYSIATAKELGRNGTSQPRWEKSGDYGYKWGSAVHELL